MTYMASPYSHPDEAVRKQRFRDACCATVWLMRSGELVFSPVVHSHPLVALGLPTDWSYWERFDRKHLTRCYKVVVLMLDGWEESAGVTAEVRLARELAKPLHYLSPERVPVGPTLAHVRKETGS